MIHKTNFLALAIITAAAFTAAPAANATVAAGMSAATSATTTAATTSAQTDIVLAHGWRGGRGWRGGHGWRHGHRGFRNCRWLQRKARRTGRRYWWKRYYRCRNAY